jgi:hypothetical protein
MKEASVLHTQVEFTFNISGPTESPIYWVPDSLPGVKAAGVWR